jgi:hypothetical protein
VDNPSVHVGAGIALIVASSALGALVVFGLWRRLAPGVAFGSVALCGMGIAAGGLLVQEDVGVASWVVALAALAVISPVHMRLVFGPPGPGGMVAPDATAA